MPLYEPIVPARYVRPLLTWAEEIAPGTVAKLGDELDFARLLRDRRDSSVSLTQWDRLVNALMDKLDRSDVGFELGCRVGIDDLGALGFVLRRCHTLDELLRLVVHYYRLITPSLSASFRRDARHAEYCIRPAGAMSQRGLHQALEALAVSNQRDLNALLGGEATIDIHLSIAPPPHRARYRNLTPTRFHFGPGVRPEVRCVLPLALLDRPLQQPGNATGVVGIAALKRALQAFKPAKHYSEWARMMLSEAETVQPTLADLAELLGMSPRQLTRHLTAEGQNLRDMGKQVRFERACAMLRGDSQSLALIAHRLGYRRVSSFVTAFRAISGTAPGAFRKRMRR